MKLIRTLGQSIALAPAIVGCSNGYPAAVSAYTITASESVGSFAAISRVAAELCRDGSTTRYIKLRLEGGQPQLDGWEKYYQSSKQVDGKLSWQEYCDEIEGTAGGVAALVGLLMAYSSMANALANEEVWDGTASRSVTTSLAVLSGGRSAVVRALTAAAPSAERIGSFVQAGYDDIDVKQLAEASETHVQAILNGLFEYISRIRTDIVQPTKKDRLEVLQLLESKTDIWTAPLDVVRIAGFVSYARSLGDLQRAESMLDRYAVLIRKMKEAHTVLATKPDHRRTANELTLAVAGIMSALAQVESVKLSPGHANGG